MCQTGNRPIVKLFETNGLLLLLLIKKKITLVDQTGCLITPHYGGFSPPGEPILARFRAAQGPFKQRGRERIFAYGHVACLSYLIIQAYYFLNQQSSFGVNSHTLHKGHQLWSNLSINLGFFVIFFFKNIQRPY